MQEAKYSFNIRYNQDGYDCQLTIRSDEGSASVLLGLGQQAIKWLSDHGATPERRWEVNGKNGNGKPESTPEPVLECPIHHKAVKSKFGGLYCPTKNKDGSYCDWKVEGD